MTLESSTAQRSAHDVLRSIRRAKTTMQLQDAYDGLISFIRVSRQGMLEKAAHAEAGKARRSPKGHPRFGAAATADQLSVESQGAVAVLKQVSLLTGAFCRRVEYVLRTTYPYADVDEAALARGPSAVRISACMAELTAELRRFHAPGLHALLSPPQQRAEATTWTDAGAALVDCTLSYATGDLNDYRLYRRLRAREYLQQLLAQPAWNTAAIAHVIVVMNETLSSPVDTFDLCTSDEAVEATCVVTPLRDPISQTVMRIPARGAACVHLEMFDVESFVQATQQRSLGTVDVGGPCPLCSSFISLSALRVDRRALEAMQLYTRSVVTAPGGGAAAPALSVDCALEWDTARHTVAVVRGRRAAPGSGAAPVDNDDDDDTPSRTPHSELAEAATKKRRIEIGGHVLYAD